jgi:hypothetical protein
VFGKGRCDTLSREAEVVFRVSCVVETVGGCFNKGLCFVSLEVNVHAREVKLSLACDERGGGSAATPET